MRPGASARHTGFSRWLQQMQLLLLSLPTPGDTRGLSLPHLLDRDSAGLPTVTLPPPDTGHTLTTPIYICGLALPPPLHTSRNKLVAHPRPPHLKAGFRILRSPYTLLSGPHSVPSSGSPFGFTYKIIPGPATQTPLPCPRLTQCCPLSPATSSLPPCSPPPHRPASAHSQGEPVSACIRSCPSLLRDRLWLHPTQSKRQSPPDLRGPVTSDFTSHCTVPLTPSPPT